MYICIRQKYKVYYNGAQTHALAPFPRSFPLHFKKYSSITTNESIKSTNKSLEIFFLYFQNLTTTYIRINTLPFCLDLSD